MARKPIVSRTLKSTEAVVLVANMEEGKIVEQTVLLARTYKDEKAMVKVASEKVDSDTKKVVGIKSAKVISAKYFMTEDEFAEKATIVPESTQIEE